MLLSLRVGLARGGVLELTSGVALALLLATAGVALAAWVDHRAPRRRRATAGELEGMAAVPSRPRLPFTRLPRIAISGMPGVSVGPMPDPDAP